MPRLFLGNFDFEHSLAGRRTHELSQSARRANVELAAAWIGLANENDAIVVPSGLASAFRNAFAHIGFSAVHFADGLSPNALRPLLMHWNLTAGDIELVPWGWTRELRETARQLGLSVNAPPHEAVRGANSRRFSFDCEREFGTGLPGSAAVTTIEEFHQCLHATAGSWVVKANFGMAGRERILGRAQANIAAAENWIARRLASDGVVFFEPWVDRIDEAGLQFEIPKTGPPQLIGVTPLLSDARGQYAGSRLQRSEASASRWEAAINAGLRVAERLQRDGYFGPAGIDAMQYRDAEGAIGIRPIQDVNARHTMGRLSLGFRRPLREGEQGSWLHVRWTKSSRGPLAPEAWCDWFRKGCPSGTRLIPTSPFRLDGHAVRHGTIVIAAPDENQLQEAESLAFQI